MIRRGSKRVCREDLCCDSYIVPARILRLQTGFQAVASLSIAREAAGGSVELNSSTKLSTKY